MKRIVEIVVSFFAVLALFKAIGRKNTNSILYAVGIAIGRGTVFAHKNIKERCCVKDISHKVLL